MTVNTGVISALLLACSDGRGETIDVQDRGRQAAP